MKKPVRILLIAAFVLLIALAEPVWLAIGGQDANTENRTLEALPTLSAETWTTFAEDFTAWFNSHLPFRSALVRLHTFINYQLGSSDNEDVILGREDWLFYNSAADGDPMANYRGEGLLTDDQLRQIADNMTALRDDLAARGAAFVIVIAPNKSRVYSEYLPDSYGDPAEMYVARQVTEYLAENTDLTVLWLYDDLMAAKETLGGRLLYHKADTHWNMLGAYVGTARLLNTLGVDAAPAETLEIAETENTICDLAGLLNLQDIFMTQETDYTLPAVPTGSGTQDENEILRGGVGDDQRSVLFLKDSYGNMVFPYLCGRFASVAAARWEVYEPAVVTDSRPDIVILECVERNIPRCLGSAYPVE